MVDPAKTAKNTASLLGTATALGINLKTWETINQIVQQSNKKRKEYETTRMIPTAKKTTTKEGRKEYMRWYMRKRNSSLKSKWINHDPLSGLMKKRKKKSGQLW